PWGGRRQQANTTKAIYLDIKPGAMPPLLTPTFAGSAKATLLEVADLCVYAAVRAADGDTADAHKFSALLKILNPVSVCFDFRREKENMHDGRGTNSFLARALCLWQLKKDGGTARCLISSEAGPWIGVELSTEVWRISESYERISDVIARAELVKAE